MVRFFYSISLAMAVVLAGCGEDAKSADPQAGLLFLHDAADLGKVEVLLDGDKVLTLEPGDLEGPIEVDVGEHAIEVRNTGAKQGILTETLTLAAQPYLLVLGAEVRGARTLTKIDQPLPELREDEAAAEVVDLHPDAFVFDVYLGDTKVSPADGLRTGDAAPYARLAAAATAIKVFNVGDDPATDLPVLAASVDFSDGGAFVVLLRKDAMTGALTAQAVPVP